MRFFLKKPIDTGFFNYDLFFKPTGSGVFELFLGGGASDGIGACAIAGGGPEAPGSTPQSALILRVCATILPRTSIGKEPNGEGRDARISGSGDGTAPQRHVQGEARERTRDHRPHGGTNAQEPHQGACGRQGSSRDDTL